MDEQALLRGIAQNPDDEVLRLVYADWLEDAGLWATPLSWADVLCEHKYPECHHLRDIHLRGEPFRLLRCVPCGERLFAYRIADNEWTNALGLPMWLEGEDLVLYVRLLMQRYPTTTGTWTQ